MLLLIRILPRPHGRIDVAGRQRYAEVAADEVLEVREVVHEGRRDEGSTPLHRAYASEGGQALLDVPEEGKCQRRSAQVHGPRAHAHLGSEGGSVAVDA